MPNVIDPFAQGTRRRISLAATRPDNGAVIADERRIHELLASPDPAQRQRAIRHLNAVAAEILPILLSSTSQFPDTQTQGVPTVVSFGEADRFTADVRWRALFQMRDMTSATSPYFKISDVFDAVTFDVYQMGERIRTATVRGDEQIYETDIVAGALQWFKFFESWQTLWNAEDGIASMNAKWLRRMGRIAIETITASGLAVTAYDDTAGASQLERDVNTINAAITELGNAVYQTETGFEGIVSEEDIEGLTLYLVYNPATAGYRNRINRALAARFDLANDNNSLAEVDVPVMPFPTRYAPANGWTLVLAGRKNVFVIHKTLQIYDRMDPRVAGIAEDRIGQGAYKGVRGDARQARTIATS